MTQTPILLAQKTTPPVPAPLAPVLPPSNGTTPAKPAAVPPIGGSTGAPADRGMGWDRLPFNGFDIAVIACLTILVALVALIPKSLIARHLVARRATPSAANAAGWMAWFFIVFATLMVLVGTLGRWWSLVVFYGPAGAVAALFLVATIYLFARALKTRR